MYQSTHKSMLFKWYTELYAELRCNYTTFIPNVWGRSGGVVTVAGGRMADVS